MSPPIKRGFRPVAGCALHRIRPVNPDDDAATATAARLHRELFGEIGPVAKLGQRLLQRYCYGHVLRQGMMKAVVFEVDGQPAGLAAYTTDSVALHQAALRSHLGFVLRETLLALLREPTLILRLPGAAGLLWERRCEKLPETSVRFAEMVAFGVMPAYRSVHFIRKTGLRVADLLMDYVLDDVRRQGFPWGRGVVLVSNRPAVRFFTARAARVEPFPSAVRPSIQVWFDLTQEPPDSAP
jgi:ribosomal protein S18 acetylase RimI-like enzyme